jgi:hypothetical protein
VCVWGGGGTGGAGVDNDRGAPARGAPVVQGCLPSCSCVVSICVAQPVHNCQLPPHMSRVKSQHPPAVCSLDSPPPSPAHTPGGRPHHRAAHLAPQPAGPCAGATPLVRPLHPRPPACSSCATCSSRRGVGGPGGACSGRHTAGRCSSWCGWVCWQQPAAAQDACGAWELPHTPPQAHAGVINPTAARRRWMAAGSVGLHRKPFWHTRLSVRLRVYGRRAGWWCDVLSGGR